MQKIIGIVAEYNPFHNGHIYQLNKIKEKYKDSIIIVCLSSSFTQRGELSILSKWEKTEVALLSGADIVIELPYVYATQSSDIFAKYSIQLLNSVHINTLCFGTEKENIEDIINAAKTQINNLEYDNLVKKYLKEGINYPTALNKALKELSNIEINEPNDLLALSYIKEIYKNKYDIELFNIKRTSNYHDILSNDDIVSASNIRYKILNNQDYKNSIPEFVYNILKNKQFNDKYFELLKYKIISDSNLDKYLDVDEGIDLRIKKVISKSNTLDELINNIKSKRYTYNKISRMLNHILCSFTKEENKQVNKLEYLRILGFNKTGQEYLNTIKKDIKLPILNSYDTNYKALEIEKRITEIYSNIYENIIDIETTNKPIIINKK
ncbi:MAG: nucleotidyltransferase [Bacilli bacterium]|nr:nucleotidyltransferase [Bacilli bacterium]